MPLSISGPFVSVKLVLSSANCLGFVKPAQNRVEVDSIAIGADDKFYRFSTRIGGIVGDRPITPQFVAGLVFENDQDTSEMWLCEDLFDFEPTFPIPS